MHIDPPFVLPSSTTASGRSQYRLYFLDGAGHIQRSHEFFADDDAAAIRTAEAWREGAAAELWCHQRKVHRWEPGRGG